MNKKLYEIVCYFATLLFAVIFLFVGHRVASAGMPDLFNKYGSYETVVAEVTKIHDRINTKQMFEAKIIKGAQFSSIFAVQETNQNYRSGVKEVEVGDKVIVVREWDASWSFVDYYRIDKIVWLGAAFVLLLLIFGRLKGFHAFLSLGLTCAAIFVVFIPSLLSGQNIYASSMIVCIFSIVVTIFIVTGVNRKSLAAIAGCSGGLIATGILTFLMNAALGITGVLNKDSAFFLYLFKGSHIVNLRAVIFAGIIIGAVGAMMDVAMSISSALWEIKEKAPGLGFGELLKSGFNISRDVMGTMSNTLVLAYIGNSLSVVVILTVYIKSFTELINRELVIIELLQAIIGSLGLLLTMPLASLICAALYNAPSNTQAGNQKVS
ncbi:MAG: YibE/F family protein [Oscillospiraceae bacterium]|jgi:uncharacterized membrane protein|nr:YibE/F family protein [Oscillospiraceae bacterium]